MWRRWKQAQFQAGRRRRRYLLRQVRLANSGEGGSAVGRCLSQNVRTRYFLNFRVAGMNTVFFSCRATESPVCAGEAECLLPSLRRLPLFRARNCCWSAFQRQRRSPVQRWCTQAAKSQLRAALFRQLMHLLRLQHVQQRHS